MLDLCLFQQPDFYGHQGESGTAVADSHDAILTVRLLLHAGTFTVGN